MAIRRGKTASHTVSDVRDDCTTHLTGDVARSVRARRALGQNFLLDSNILDRIVLLAGDLRGKRVLEIGPGPGGLTRALLRSAATSIHAVEKDKRFVAELQPLLHEFPQRFSLRACDVLHVELTDLLQEQDVIMGNLAFNIASQLLVRLLDHTSSIDRMVFMFQKEVADRIVAEPGNRTYGRLSVLVQWSCHAEVCMALPPGAFVPRPRVSASLLRITPRAAPLHPVGGDALRVVTKAAFGQRRKTLRNALKNVCADTEALLDHASVSPRARAEDLDVPTFCRLAASLEHVSRQNRS